MSKRSFSRKSSASKSANKPSTRMNPNNMMAQMQQMQAEMAEAQVALEQEFVTVTAGGGAISITISGHQRVQSITLDKELLNPDDAEMVQDMLVAAVNSAIEQSQAMAAERMEGITGGAAPGGLDSLLGGLGLG